MITPSSAEQRPSRLSAWFLAVGSILLLISTVSGVLIWWSQTANAAIDPLEAQRTLPVKTWATVHGVVSPFLSILFGYLCAHHIPSAWKLRANRITGVSLTVVLSGLIATGAGLYYAGSPFLRESLVWMHRIFGLAIPLVMGWHIWAAVRWTKKL